MLPSNLLYTEAQLATDYIKTVFTTTIPTTAIILGSGLGDFTNIVEVLESIDYADIPYMQHNTLQGHKGRLTIAKLDNSHNVLIMEGRFHYYQGFTPQQVTYPIVIFHLLGIKNLLVSNAAGGINPLYEKGALMIINDHINLTGNNPLCGTNRDVLGPRFLDQTEPYSPKLIKLAHKCATELNINIHEGVYISVSGPTYETKAEIRAFGRLGADAVGMSTVFEVIVANYFNIEVLGISAITNMGTGLAPIKHTHADVVNAANKISQDFSILMKNIILSI